MSIHDFAPLHEQYPAVIDQMPQEFTSHEFILRLAQQYQRLYVDALHSYRDTTRLGTPAPFMNVHRELSKGLRSFPELVTHIADDAPSTDIFDMSQSCARWRKV